MKLMPNKFSAKCKVQSAKSKKLTNHYALITNHSKVKRGFTLVELLVVITIIGVLLGGTTFVFNNARQKGRDTERKQDLHSISGALALYYQDNKQYPPLDLGNTQTDFISGDIPVGATDWIPDLVPTYIKKLPIDPKQLSQNVFNFFAGIFGKDEPQGQVAPASDAAMEAFWKLNETSGTTASDSSG